MNRSIYLRKEEVSYTLIVSARAKHVRVSISKSKGIRVTKPRFVPQFVVDSFLRKKEAWIVDTINRLGKVPISDKATHKEYEVYKAGAKILVEERLAHFKNVYEVTWNRVSIRNQKTRWGSCSSQGNLNFSYKLALLPSHLVDYIVVHEMCHLQEMNHSEAFWNLVARAVPDYKELRKELKGIAISFEHKTTEYR